MNTKIVKEAFNSLDGTKLEIDTIICPLCGCVLHRDKKSKPPCEHLTELFQEWIGI